MYEGGNTVNRDIGYGSGVKPIGTVKVADDIAAACASERTVGC